MVADAGEKVDIKGEPGGVVKVNPVFVAVPTLFVTLTLPDEPDPTTAFILTDVSETILKDAAGVPPKLTAVTLLRLLP